MPIVTYVEHSGIEHRVEAPLDRSLMQIALDNSIDGILGDCGGACSCATCHAYIDQTWAAKLPAIAETEAFMLEGVLDRTAQSRLCCQIKVTSQMDGLIITLPAEQA